MFRKRTTNDHFQHVVRMEKKTCVFLMENNDSLWETRAVANTTVAVF